MRLVVVALVAGCGAATLAPEPSTCRPATYACSVMAARDGVTARVSTRVATGESTTAEIAGDGFRCSVELRSRAPEDHTLDVACDGATFALREPSHAFESDGPWSVEATCWYAQEGHRTDCDTCRAIDYCEGPDVE